MVGIRKGPFLNTMRESLLCAKNASCKCMLSPNRSTVCRMRTGANEIKENQNDYDSVVIMTKLMKLLTKKVTLWQTNIRLLCVRFIIILGQINANWGRIGNVRFTFLPTN